MARESTVLLCGSAAVLTVLAGWIVVSQRHGPDAAANHATVGVARGAAVPAATAQPLASPPSNPLLARASIETPASADAADGENAIERVSIVRQRLQRGGLGSQALGTFTLRNRNNFAVSGIEMTCTFRSRDGRYVTERRHVISDTIDARRRKTFPRELVGFVNIQMSQGRCDLVTARRDAQG